MQPAGETISEHGNDAEVKPQQAFAEPAPQSAETEQQASEPGSDGAEVDQQASEPAPDSTETEPQDKEPAPVTAETDHQVAEPAPDTAEVGQEASAPAKRTCLLVLGMHRSGTSALTRVISLLGAGLPANMLGANEGNPTGHWEPQRIVDINDRMLAETASHWDDWRRFDNSALPPERQAAYLDEIADILRQEFGAHPLFVLKEPRISRFAPLYLDLLSQQDVETKVVVIFRNPLAVAQSLQKRGGMSITYAALLWLRHVLDAEKSTRHLDRIFVSYENLMADWRPVVDRLIGELPLDWLRTREDVEAEVDAFLSSDLQHHTANDEDLANIAGSGHWVVAVHNALKALEAKVPMDLGILDSIQNELDSWAGIFAPAFYDELSARTQPIQTGLETYRSYATHQERVLEGMRTHGLQIAEQVKLISEKINENHKSTEKLHDELRVLFSKDSI